MDKVLENRICLLIKEMTLEEKTGMIHGAGLFRTAGVERIHIPPLKMSDGRWVCAASLSMISGCRSEHQMIM